MNMVMFPLIFICILLNAAAQLLLKAGMMKIGHFDVSWENLLPIGLKVALVPHILLGLLCYVLSVVAWMVVLSRVEVSVAYPLASLGYIITAIAAFYLFNEPFTSIKIIGIAVIIFGVFLITRS